MLMILLEMPTIVDELETFYEARCENNEVLIFV
jgi:hypothetical protein